MKKEIYITYASYDTCAAGLELLEKVGTTLTDAEKVKYKTVQLMLEEMKFDFLVEEVRGVLSLQKNDFLTRAQMEDFLERRPELVNTTLGSTMLEMYD